LLLFAAVPIIYCKQTIFLCPIAFICYNLRDVGSYVVANLHRSRKAEAKHIGLRDIRSLRAREIVWDTAVPGFGARRQTGAAAYVLKYHTDGGRQRWHTIGRHGAPWTPDTARKEARRLLAEVAQGADPAAEKQAKRKAETVAQLCDAYWADAESGNLLTRRRAPKKTLTLRSDKGRIDKHIRPLLGHMKVAALTRADIEAFMRSVAEGKTAARSKTGKKRGLSNVRGGRGTAGSS
jgi:Arm DNA-binding domain